jgi:VWFA-related protein
VNVFSSTPTSNTLRTTALVVLALALTASPLAAQTAPQTPSPAAAKPATGVTALPAAQTPATSTPTAASSPAAATTPQTAPNNAPANADDIPTIRVQANEVNLVFTVTDKKGRFVPGLKQENFGLLDDHRAPLRVSNFTLARNLPLRVGIMLDTSSSIRQRFQFEQDSAIEFLLQVLHLNDRAFIEGFDIQTDLAQGFTNNVDFLNQGIRKLRPGGGTALYDALYKTCRDQMLTLRDTYAVRRAIILVSDGDDNYSRALQSDAIKECQRADTIVYAISTNVSPSKDKGDEVLDEIAKATGGQAFFPIKIEDVAQGFHNIEEELRSQYSLIYTPADFKNDGSFRTIYLQALDPRYHVRAKLGYFAPRAPE